MLPNGAILLAGDQLGGRGRGSNTWLSSKGCLQFTLLLHHQAAATLTLLQYLVGLAMLEAIVGEPGHELLPIRLKWPNDLYTFSPRHPERKEEMRKLAGILVNSQTFNDGYILVIGMGTNVHDTPWTRSLNDLIAEYNAVHGTRLAPWNKELLLARFVSKFAELYRSLLVRGFPFDQYYQRWLHTGQVVHLEDEQLPARIEGIDAHGYLVARPHVDGLLGLLSPQAPEPGSPKAHPFLLQPDGNSFDMMQNLIKRKL